MRNKVTLIFLIFNFVAASLVCQNQQWVVYTPTNSGLPHHWIRAIAIESNGTKWFGTEDGIAKLSGNSWTAFNNSNSSLPNPPIVKAIAIDASGNKWFGFSSQGLVKYDGTNWTSVNTGLPSLWINCLTFDATGNLWVGTSNGIAIINSSNVIVFNTSNSSLPNNDIKSIEFDAAGSAWIGTNGAGLVKFDGSNWSVYNTSNSGLPDNYIRSIAIDANGTKWIGTYSGGLAKFDGTSWTVFNTSNSGLPYNSINCITIDANGNKWIGTYGSGLVKYDGSSWTVFNYFNSGLYDNDIRSIKIDAYGNKWIGTMAGVAVYNEQGVGFENATLDVENNARIYPNPAKDYAFISFNVSELPHEMCEIIVYDLTGKEHLRQQIQDSYFGDNCFVIKLDCSGLSKGMYLCEVRSKNALIAKQKFVIE